MMDRFVGVIAGVTAAVALATPHSATAANGVYLLEACEALVRIQDAEAADAPKDDDDLLPAGYCVGFVAGLMGGQRSFNTEQPEFCIPFKSVANSIELGTILKWLREHSDQLHNDETQLALLALSEVFPCKPSE